MEFLFGVLILALLISILQLIIVLHLQKKESEDVYQRIISYARFHLATHEHMQHQQHNQEDFRFISELPALKSSNLIDFSKIASNRLKNHQKISD
jgi:hypothetical protein